MHMVYAVIKLSEDCCCKVLFFAVCCYIDIRRPVTYPLSVLVSVKTKGDFFVHSVCYVL